MNGMAKAWIGLAVIVAAFTGYVWFMWPEEPPPPEPITLHEAQSVLDEIATHAEAGRFDLLCSRSGSPEGMCWHFVDFAGWRNVPLQRPYVVSVEDISNEFKTSTNAIVCGTRADGTRFATRWEIIRLNDGFVVPHPVYWTGMPSSVIDLEDPTSLRSSYQDRCDEFAAQSP